MKKNKALLTRFKTEKNIPRKLELLKKVHEQGDLASIYEQLLGIDKIMRYEASKLMCESCKRDYLLPIIKGLEQNNFAVAGGSEQTRLHEDFKKNLMIMIKDITSDDFDIPDQDNPKAIDLIIKKAKDWHEKNNGK